MEGMFRGTTNLDTYNTTDTPDLSDVESISYMFHGSSFNASINDWDTSNVKYMNYMFAGSEFNRDISRWNTSNVEDMNLMFGGAESFNRNISSWCVDDIDTKPDQFDISDRDIKAGFYNDTTKLGRNVIGS